MLLGPLAHDRDALHGEAGVLAAEDLPGDGRVEDLQVLSRPP